jgi:two-component system CheB/CheR fusion protein
MFQYALNPGGYLFLGTSEGIGDFGELFAVVDRKAKLFQCKRDVRGGKRSAANLFLSRPMAVYGGPRATTQAAQAARLPLRELTERALLRQVALAAALVGANGDILYLHGRTGMYLEPTAGEAGVNNVLKMAREGLRRDLTTALFQAAASNAVTRARGLRVKTNGHFTTVNLSVYPVSAGADAPAEVPLFLLVWEDAPPLEPEAARAAGATAPGAAPAAAHPAEGDPSWDVDVRVAALQQDLRANEEYLQSANEELETANEELKCSNEEMQSVNEELQSTNEELETSREEMQSINEELTTVNAELQMKVQDWTRANNDLQNMLVGTGIATIFVDHQLRILRFTPAVTGLINLIPADTGRPVGDLAAKLVGYDRFVPDVQAVLDTLVPREAEVQTTSGAWFLMRIQPYRTLENVIEGAVISFVDITAMKRMRAALQSANEQLRLAVVVRDAHDAITVHDLEGRTLAWNPGAVRMYGWTEAEALRLNVRDRIPAGLQVDAVARLQQLSRSEVLEPDRTQRLTKAGAVLNVSVISTALLTEAGKIYAIATTERARDAEMGA